MGEVTLVALRTVLTFVSLLIFCRMMGKTQISQLTFFEYVTGITLGSIAGEVVTDLNMRPWPMYVSMLVWVGMVLLTQWVAMKSRWWDRMMDGAPVVVIQNGQLLEGNLRSVRMRQGELDSLLRNQGVFDHRSVEFAVMEPNGELSVLKTSQSRPVTPADLNLPTSYEGLGIELVVDGEVMMENLRRLHVNRAWLEERLREKGVSSISEVFLAVLDSAGQIYVDKYRDLVPETDQLGDYPGPN